MKGGGWEEGLSQFPPGAGFFVSCSHAQAELVSSSAGRFVICISGLKLFTGACIQASLPFPLSLICDWQADGFKHFCPNGSLACLVLPSLCLTHTATWHMLCVLRAEAASRQTKPGGHAGPGQPRGCDCSQITGQSVQRADARFPWTESTTEQAILP